MVKLGSKRSGRAWRALREHSTIEEERIWNPKHWRRFVWEELAPPKVEGKKCPHCGKLLDPKWKMCPYCGHRAEKAKKFMRAARCGSNPTLSGIVIEVKEHESKVVLEFSEDLAGRAVYLGKQALNVGKDGKIRIKKSSLMGKDILRALSENKKPVLVGKEVVFRSNSVEPSPSETSCGDAKLYRAVCYICGHEICTQTEKRADEALRRHFRLKHGVVVPEKIVDGKIEPISSRTRKRAGAVSAEVERAVEALKNFLRRSAAMPEGAMERSNDRNVSVCPFLCSAMLMCTAEVEKPFNESGLASEYCFSEHDKCDAYRTQTAVNSDLLSSRRMVAYELAKYSVGSNTRIYIPRPIVRKCVRGCPIKQECKQVLKRAEEGVL